MSSRLVASAALTASLILLCPVAGAQPEPAADAQEADKPDKQAQRAAAAADETEQLLADIAEIQSKYRALEAQERNVSGEEKTVVVLQIRSQVLEFIRKVDTLVKDVVRQREAGVARPKGLKRTRALILEMDRSIPRFIDSLEKSADELRASLGDASEDVRDDLEIQLRGSDEVLDEAYPFFLDHLGHRESLGLDAEKGRKALESRLGGRASRLAGRVELLSQRRDAARKEAEESPDDAARQADLRSANERLDAAASSLWTTCDVMDEMDLPTAEYRTVLIRSTGEITGDVLDVEVVKDLLGDGVEAMRRWLDRRGPAMLANILLFAAILALFWVLGGFARRLVARWADRTENINELSRRMLVGTASRTVVVVGFFIALSQVGVDVTALLAGLGIAGFIVGFALQDTLGNFASGTMILVYRPFDVGDVVEAGGVYGTVYGMSLVSTTILTFDNQTLVVPNSKIWGDVIRNVTEQDRRRVDLEFDLAHTVDVVRAEEILTAMVSEHPKVLDDPAPMVKVHKLTESGTHFIVRPWTKREDYWEVYWDLMREAKLRLDRENIPLGVPRRELEVYRGPSD